MAGAEERRVYARALFRAGAKMRACALQDRELRAGAMLRLAGFSAGRSVCARGGCSAGQSESIAAFCVRIMTGARFYRNVLRSVHAYRTFLSECLAFGSRPSRVSIEMSCVRFTPIARFYRNVLRSVHAYRTFLSKCLAFGSRLLFAAERQTGRLARRCVPIPPWVGIAGSAFSDRRCGYPDFLVHFGLARFLWRSRREHEGTRGTEAARRGCVFA